MSLVSAKRSQRRLKSWRRGSAKSGGEQSAVNIMVKQRRLCLLKTRPSNKTCCKTIFFNATASKAIMFYETKYFCICRIVQLLRDSCNEKIRSKWHLGGRRRTCRYRETRPQSGERRTGLAGMHLTPSLKSEQPEITSVT